MRVRCLRRRKEKTELQMTAMIDVVFLLLVFFVMTFTVVLPEGDFGITMPAHAAGPPRDVPQPPTLCVQLRADADGGLAGVVFNDQPLSGMDALRSRIIGLIGEETGPNSLRATTEVEFTCDANLDYEHVIAAITAVSGHVNDQRQIVKLVEKIRFAPPEKR